MTQERRPPLLCLEGISKSYGPTEVLRGFELEVHAGEVVALLGENGAGKSTVSNIVAGSILPTSGNMTWLGQPYAPTRPKEAMDLGIGLIHQELRLLEHLSVAENVFVGRWPKKNGLVDRETMMARAHRQLERLGLNVSAGKLVRGLSTANQQLIEIAKALTWDARLLILDEPTAALGRDETLLLFKQIERLKSEGVGIIYISHRLEEIRQIADRIIVLRDGDKVQEFESGKVAVRTIVEAMVGRSLDRMFPEIPRPDDEVVLEVRDLSSPHGTFGDVSFDVKKGEIFGIAGLVGAGRTELVRAITGADPIASGSVHLHGKDITPRTPGDAIRNGIVLVPEDRKLQGLVLDHGIAENIAYVNIDTVVKWGILTAERIRALAKEVIAKFGIRGNMHQNADELSGGNQQKVVIAKWLARNPQVVFLDEPTRGIDVGARASIYNIIVGLASKGVAVIVVSSDLEEILGVSNRISVMAQGKQVGILDRDKANDVSVMELATI